MQKKVWLVGHFISSINGCVDKSLTRIKINDHATKRDKLICI
jgi:hypothetical protein